MNEEKMWYNLVIILIIFHMALLNMQINSLRDLLSSSIKLNDQRQERNTYIQEMDLNITKEIIIAIRILRSDDDNCTK